MQIESGNSDNLLKYHSSKCGSGKYFHSHCLGYKRLPNNAKTSWICSECKLANLSSGQEHSNKSQQGKVISVSSLVMPEHTYIPSTPICSQAKPHENSLYNS